MEVTRQRVCPGGDELPQGASMSLSPETVQRAARGDRDSQQQVYEAMSSRVHALVRRIVGEHAADDVTQDVFIHVFTKMQTFNQESAFETWVYRLAVNDALQYLRRERRRSTLKLDESTVAKRADRADLDIRELIEVAMARLETELRIILQLKEIDKLPYEQIAQVVGVPVGTVGSRLNKARRLLRDELRQLGWEG